MDRLVDASVPARLGRRDVAEAWAASDHFATLEREWVEAAYAVRGRPCLLPAAQRGGGATTTWDTETCTDTWTSIKK